MSKLVARMNTMAPPSVAYQKQYAYDAGGNVIYEGWAAPGIATAAPLWAIKRYTYSGSNVVAEQWAGGNACEAYIWDDRSSLNYS